jgi:hypothetical protein
LLILTIRPPRKIGPEGGPARGWCGHPCAARRLLRTPFMLNARQPARLPNASPVARTTSKGLPIKPRIHRAAHDLAIQRVYAPQAGDVCDVIEIRDGARLLVRVHVERDR